jgi:hypothetical protein
MQKSREKDWTIPRRRVACSIICGPTAFVAALPHFLCQRLARYDHICALFGSLVRSKQNFPLRLQEARLDPASVRLAIEYFLKLKDVDRTLAALLDVTAWHRA